MRRVARVYLETRVGGTAVKVGAAAMLAALTFDPTPVRSDAAAVIISGSAIT